MRDIRKLRKALKFIRKYPDYHDQADWVGGHFATFDVAASNGEHPPCGTTLCLAGWLAFLSAPAGAQFHGSVIYAADGSYLGHASDYGQAAANLSGDQANVLFYAAKNADDLGYVIDHLAKHPKADEDELRDAMTAGRTTRLASL